VTAKKTVFGVGILAMAALSFYFIFQGMELIGISLLVVSGLLEYLLTRTKKTA
jgi:hypothetical protein